MELVTQIYQFIEQPFPLWKTTLTHQLVQQQWEELKEKGFENFDDYSTAGIWLNKPSLKLEKRKPIFESNLYVEMPSAQLQSFYDEHGLELLTENEMETDAVIFKLNKAFSILRLIKPVYDCITNLVQSIHILRQPDADTDLSYSHPQIPFSIFVSVCENNSTVSNLRVAESILHEAMHLKLTLIENLVPLIKPDTNNLYYSPWRDEERPVKGVLHGLFVFRAIKDFYELLLAEDLASFDQENDFVKYRVEAIHYELQLLTDFPKSEGLTHFGKELAKKLLI